MSKENTELQVGTWYSQDHIDRAEMCRAFLLEYGFTVPCEDREIDRRINAARDRRDESHTRLREPDDD